MARARLLKPGFFTNEDLAELSMPTRLLYVGLWTLADREGRLEDRPRRIKAEVFPYDDVDVAAGLDDLVERGLVQRYTVDGDAYLAIPTFKKHQKIHPREAASEIPPPPEAVSRCAEGNPRFAQGTPRQPEAEAEAEAEALCGNRAMALDAPSAKKVTTAFLERMSVEHPALDVDAEWEKASNHKAYDKAKDKQRYFQNWLKRAEEFKARYKPPPSRTNGHKVSHLPWAEVVT